MKKQIARSLALACTAVMALASSPASAQQVTQAPAEFRGGWISTVFGLDFPAGSTAPNTGRARINQLLDRMQAAGLNAVVFQVRGECDAMYVSSIEPWNRWLTSNGGGGSGVAPSRIWDPLQYTIDECRRRGMEIHAWFNPYRAGTTRSITYAANHPSRARTDITRAYNDGSSEYWWLDPGDPATRAYSLAVIMDVVTRYDIDAVHFDDYFYPYGITTNNPFPDSTTYAAYTSNGGNLSLANWRRAAVNTFVQEVQTAIRNAPNRQHVRFGISPFGIWRPGNPTGITGLDSFASLYADSRLWLQQGWVDYMAPQLYWKRAADGGASGQDFDALLTWWSNSTQNPLRRHMWPGISPSWMTPATQAYSVTDLLNQVTQTQANANATGNIHFRTAVFLENSGAGRQNYTTLLANGAYARPALPPATTWLDNTPPANPVVAWTGSPGVGPITAHWAPSGTEYPQWYIVYYSSNSGTTWNHIIRPDWAREAVLPGTGASTPNRIAIQAVDRVGNRSTAVIHSVVGPSGPIPAPFSTTFVQNFEGLGTGAAAQFVTNSGSNIGISGASSLTTALELNNRVDPRAANPGSVASRNLFTWTGTSGGFYRLTTAGAASRPNPAIDLRQGFGFYYKLLSGELEVRLFVRETGGAGPIGANGGTTGAIERTSPKRLRASPNWQYVWFDLPNESYSSFSSGNGILDGTWGTFEALGIYQVAGGGTSFELYLDDIHQGQQHTPIGEPLTPRTVPPVNPPPSAPTGFLLSMAGPSGHPGRHGE
jgi:uncharacterized lipoprotein YddW (UPF0748 family)